MNCENWYGYKISRFTFEDREAIIVFPKETHPGSPWALKTEYWDAFPDIETRLLAEGFHVAYVKNKNRWFTREECDAKARFVRFVSAQYNLNPKCVPIGMSCCGGYAVKFGGMYPELIQCMYIDAPVLNLCSIPGSHEHPICQADSLISHNIPVLLVCGNEDQTVLYEENGKLLVEAFGDSDLLTVINVPMRGHHPHGMIGDNQVIVDYILANS